MKYEGNYENIQNKEFSFLNGSSECTSKDNEKLLKICENLNMKIDKLIQENNELKKINRSLNDKINLLINDNNIVKNVKNDMNDCSDYTHFNNEDSLKEFFYLLVLCEKMKYLNIDFIWMVDPGTVYKEAITNDIPFYEWQNFIMNKLSLENYNNNIKLNNLEKQDTIISKLKYL